MLLFGLQLILALAPTQRVDATSTTRIVTPDLAGMIYPPTSASRVVRFGDPSSSLPSAYEYIAPSTDPVACTDARLCLELQISSVFEVDPFFLHGYDTNTPLVSATFDGLDSGDILPLIPGVSDTDPTVWWFQANGTADDTSSGSATGAPPTIDLQLHLRQRSQRLSARDQLLVQMRVELVDARSTSSFIESFVMYGSQRVSHTTTRIDTKTIRVLLSITRDTQKSDVDPLDAYPLIPAAAFVSPHDSGAAVATCDACGDFLDACRDIPLCHAVVLPCLISRLETLASDHVSGGSGSGYNVNAGSTGSYSGSERSNAGDFGGSDDMEAGDAGSFSGSLSRFLTELETEKQEESTSTTYSDTASGSLNTESGSGQTGLGVTKRVDLLEPLAMCVANHSAMTWAPIRQSILCLSRLNCALGISEGEDAGDEVPATFWLSNGWQKFALIPTTTGTDNLDITVVRRSILSSSTDQQMFAYVASASYLDMFLRSVVLNGQTKVSVSVEPYSTSPKAMRVALEYSDALVLCTIDFYTKEGQVSMVENLPAQAAIEYPASSPRPVLDKLLNELRARIHSPGQTNHSWILAQECLSCSAQFFGCSAEAIADHSCSYNAMKSTIGKCIEQQLPATSYEAMIQGSFSEKPVSAELSRCVLATAASADTATDTISSLMRASSSLACFAASRCPFGPIELVRDTKSIMLETTSYIQVLRISISSLTDTMSIKIEYKVGDMLIGSTATIYSTSSKYEIEQVIKKVLALAGIEVSVSTLIGENTKTEWVLEIVYHYVFLSAKFSADAVVNGALAKSDAMKQIMMEGGAAELRAVPRDRSKIFSEAEIDHPSVSASHGMDTNSSHSGEGSIEGSGPSADPSSESSSIGSHPGADSSSSSVSGSLGQNDEGFVSSSGSDLDDEGSGSLGHDDVGYTSLSGSGSIGTDDAGLSSSSGSDFDKGSSDSKTLGPVDASYVSSSGSGDLGPDGVEYTSSSGSDFDDAASSNSGALNTDDAGHAS